LCPDEILTKEELAGVVNVHHSILRGKTILITGGGTLGTELVEQLIKYDVHAIRVIDNSEQSLFKLQLKFGKESRLRYLLGDVTDYDRIEFAMKGADYVIHTAANKFVHFIEYNPFQAIHTNIIGTINVIKGTIKVPSVKKMVYISSDKACEPTSIYGMTKAIGERLVWWASRISDKTFVSIRFPNFFPSRGSVFEIWEEQSRRGEPLTITDKRMTRYFIPITEAARLTLKVLIDGKTGHIYVPKNVRKYKIMDLAKKYKKSTVVVGKRLGERLHEKLLTDEEKEIMKETKEFYIIPPPEEWR